MPLDLCPIDLLTNPKQSLMCQVHLAQCLEHNNQLKKYLLSEYTISISPLPFTFCSPSSSACLCPDARGMHYPGIFAACPVATGNRRLADGRETLRTSSHSPLLLHFAPGVALFPLQVQLPRGGSSSMVPALTGLQKHYSLLVTL